MKGYVIPDENLRKTKGYHILDSLYGRNPIIHSAIDDVTHSLFNIFRKEHFEVTCAKLELIPVFAELVSDHAIEGIYGNHYFGLDGFLTDVFRNILVFGKTFYPIDYGQIQDKKGAYWKIRRIRWLPPETMTIKRKKGNLACFYQQYSKSCEDKKLCEKTVFMPDEIFFVEWIFTKGLSNGVSPLKSLILHADRHLKFLKVMTSKTYAMAHPEDRSLKAERARYASWDKEKELNDISELIIRATIGTWSNAPMTEYFATVRFAQSRQKIAIIREYLVEQFNIQVVSNLSKKNSLNEPARIKLKGYLTSEQIGNLISRYEKTEISQEEILKTLQNDMSGKS
jgi:hypothetical protein